MVKDIPELERILQQDGAFRGLAPRAKAKALLCFLEEYHPDVHAQIGSVLKDGEKENDVPFNPPVSVSGEAGLVVVTWGKMYCVEQGKKYRIPHSGGFLKALAFHDGGLYGSNLDGAIFNIASGKVVAQRSDLVCALVSHDGSLYDGGRDCAVFDTLSGRKVAQRSDWVRALVSHEGRLYDGSKYGVFDTLSGNVVARRDHTVNALVSHDGRLYSGEVWGVFDAWGDEEVEQYNPSISLLASTGCSLFGTSFNDGYGIVFDALLDPKGEHPLCRFDIYLDAMASIPFPLWEELARKGALVRN